MFASNGETVSLCLVKNVTFISLGDVVINIMCLDTSPDIAQRCAVVSVGIIYIIYIYIYTLSFWTCHRNLFRNLLLITVVLF